jgi:hypothetical protein
MRSVAIDPLEMPELARSSEARAKPRTGLAGSNANRKMVPEEGLKLPRRRMPTYKTLAWRLATVRSERRACKKEMVPEEDSYLAII